MSLVEKNYPLYIAIVCVLFFLNDTTGFDFYSHSIIYYFNDHAISKSHDFFGNVIPRYILLSYIYSGFSIIGIPLGYVAILLIFFPIYKMISSISADKQIELVIVIPVLVYLSLFYSAFSVSIIWFFAFLFSKNKIFLMGFLFSPFSLILYYAYSVMTLNFRLVVLLTLILLTFLGFNQILLPNDQQQTSFGVNIENVRHSIGSDNIENVRHSKGSDIIQKSGFVGTDNSRHSIVVEKTLLDIAVANFNQILRFIKLKHLEFSIAAFVATFYVLSSGYLLIPLKKINKSLPKILSYFLGLILVALVSLTAYTSFSSNMPTNVYHSILKNEANKTMRISWLDFFSKTKSGNPRFLLEVETKFVR